MNEPPFPRSKPDVYVVVVLNDDASGAATGKPSGVRVTNELDNSWSTQTGRGVSAFSGTGRH